MRRWSAATGASRTGQLDERATRLAHYLPAQGIGRGRPRRPLPVQRHRVHRGQRSRRTRSARSPININYRYVEEELEYLFDNADLVALVHHREFAPRIAAVARRSPKLQTFVSVDDGSGADVRPSAQRTTRRRSRAASPERDFAPRSGDDLYILYTGGTTGMPKGVMWRHEDLFFAAMMGGNPYGPPPERPEQVAENAAGRAASMTHAAGRAAHARRRAVGDVHHSLGGGKTVLAPGKRFDPQLVWRLVAEEKVNTIAIVGDAMARPLAEALDAASATTFRRSG